jgi:hypothetical protein
VVDWTERIPEEGRLRMDAKRFRITFATVRNRRLSYHVCTCLDARKALVIAAACHDDRHPDPDDRIYEVIEVLQVEGNAPQSADLCDRAEW